ncbi:MAG TPA: DNA repair protein RecN [Burkholderiales bacterium]|nr:DNA repair protein RecN [Burkholderiales bacterium]
MLAALAIRDFAIVDRLDLEFEPGFTALTGETGAGKSILIDALALALGERADPAVVRAGAERAEVTAEFAIERLPEVRQWLAEAALEGDPGRLLLRRVVERGGRSRAFVNGTAATVQQLAEVSEWLVDIHGQHAHQSLTKPAAQRALLDAHAGLAALARDVAAAFREWQRLARARADHETNAAARTAERDSVAWQVDELKKLGLKPGEWDGVQAEQTRLAHAASLIEGAQAALEALSESDGSAASALGAAAVKLRALKAYDATLGEPLELLEGAAAQLDDAAHALRRYTDRVELDPQRLAEVERRVDAIHSTARKFKVSPDTLIELSERLTVRLAELEIASDVDALRTQEAAARNRYEELAGKLSASRKEAAAKLGRQVTAAMKELAMTGGRMEIALRAVEGGGAGGNETVEFMVAANPGTPPQPLAKVASGGELSRIGLAVQVITAKNAAVPTLIFDEVDAGIGGAVAEVVGRKLRTLGAERQVLCVTHLAQVAAQAAQQWSVAKMTLSGATRSRVVALDDKARVEEIARMLGGVEITATTRRHAAEMLGAAARSA